jgi:hypothetical protein
MKRVFASCRVDGLCWFRIFGFGLSIRDIRKYPLLFSERNRIQKIIRFRNVVIRLLPRATWGR